MTCSRGSSRRSPAAPAVSGSSSEGTSASSRGWAGGLPTRSSSSGHWSRTCRSRAATTGTGSWTRRGSGRSSLTSGVDDPLHLDAALVAWHRVALREWASESWLAVESLQPIRLRLEAVQRRLAERGRHLSLADTWKLVNAPVDEDGLELLATLALAITGDRVARPQLTFLLDTARLRGASLEDAERAGREARSSAGSRCSTPGVAASDRACRRARGGGCRARRRTAPCRSGVPHGRALPLVRPLLRALVPAVRPLRRNRLACVI